MRAEFAHHHRTRGPPLLNHGGVDGGSPVGVQRRAAGGADARGHDDVLVGDGDAQQRRGARTLEEGGLGGAGLLTGHVGGEGDVGDEGLLQPLAACEEGIDELDGGELAAAKEGAGLGDAEVSKVNGL